MLLLVAFLLQSLASASCLAFLREDINRTGGETHSETQMVKKFSGLLAVGGGGAPLSAEIWFPDETLATDPPCQLIKGS